MRWRRTADHRPTRRPRPSALLPTNLTRLFVRAQTLKRRMADLALVGPLGELDLGHEPRRGPVRVAAKPAGRRRRERTGLHFDALERRAQLARALRRESRADLAREHQPILLIRPDEQRADTLTRTFRIGEAADHEFLSSHALGFQPALAFAGQVRLIAPLRDDALESEAARFTKRGRTVGIDVVGELDARAPDDLLQRCFSGVQ